MARTARIIGNSGFYHIVARGIGKQILFEDESDYLYFLGALKRCKAEEDFEVIAYCLMENHFHLLMRIDSGMDRIMKKLLIRYALYFNTKYERVGYLFQDRYKSVPVENDLYLLSAVRYIHNNPAKAGICSADKYRWSSMRAYLGGTSLVKTDLVLGILGGREQFIRFSNLPDEEDTEHLEIQDRRKVTENAAKEIIREKLHLESGTQLQSLDREHRDQALRILKQEGLSLRQIERLTGINRGTIHNA